jgi:hypothetical protein
MDKLIKGVELYNSIGGKYPNVELKNMGKKRRIYQGRKKIVTVMEAWYTKMQYSFFD